MNQRKESAARLRALVVDDDDDIRLLICRALQRVGFEVLDFPDGESLIAQPAELAQAHVVVSDIGLPGVDGIDVCISLRRYFPQLPVILVTAFRDEALERRAQAAGARRIMTKPLNINLLAEQARQLTLESR
jgi:CheY-like chemotaxis protein